MIARVWSRHLTTILAGYVVSVCLYSWLPAPVSGSPPQLSFSRPMLAFLLPTATALIYALLRFLWNRDPVRDRGAAIEGTYDAILFRILLFIVGIHLVVLATLLVTAAGLGPLLAPTLSRIVRVWLGLALVGIGNLLPRLRPNVVVGIRTSRTLADRGAWTRTNRAGANVTVGLGVAIAATSAIHLPGPGLAATCAGAALVAIAALVLYVRRSSTGDVRP
jgi:hypothetical protein